MLINIYIIPKKPTVDNTLNNNSTLVMVAALAAVAILAAAVVVLPIQQVSAQDTKFVFKNKGIARSSGFAISSNIQSNCFSASGSVTC
jgi:hypothetical protein